MKEGMVDIRPKFFEDESGRVDTDIDTPLLCGVSEGSLACRIVQVGDTRGCARANNFAAVEGCGSGIEACDDDAAERIAGAFKKLRLCPTCNTGCLRV